MQPRLQDGACFQRKHTQFSSLLNRFKWQNNCWLKWKLSKPQPLYSSTCAWCLCWIVFSVTKLAVSQKERAIQNEECPCPRDDEPSFKWDLIILIIAYIKRDPYIPYLARFVLFVKKQLKLHSQNGACSFVCVFFSLRKLMCVKIAFN